MKNFNFSLKKIVVAVALAGAPIMIPAQLKANEIENNKPLIAQKLDSLSKAIKETKDLNRKLFSCATKKDEMTGIKGQMKDSLSKINAMAQNLANHHDDPITATLASIATELNGFLIDWNNIIQEPKIYTAKMAAVVNNYATKRDAKIRTQLIQLKDKLENESNQIGLVALKELLNHIDALLTLDYKALGHASETSMVINLIPKGFTFTRTPIIPIASYSPLLTL